jgi:hypothetical protein
MTDREQLEVVVPHSQLDDAGQEALINHIMVTAVRMWGDMPPDSLVISEPLMTQHNGELAMKVIVTRKSGSDVKCPLCGNGVLDMSSD